MCDGVPPNSFISMRLLILPEKTQEHKHETLSLLKFSQQQRNRTNARRSMLTRPRRFIQHYMYIREHQGIQTFLVSLVDVMSVWQMETSIHPLCGCGPPQNVIILLQMIFVANMDPRVLCIFTIFTSIILNYSFVTSRMSKKLFPPMKEDIPFIKCDVCQKGMKYLHRKAKSMRDESAAKKVV